MKITKSRWMHGYSKRDNTQSWNTRIHLLVPPVLVSRLAEALRVAAVGQVGLHPPLACQL
jgi:hypothetical protein